MLKVKKKNLTNVLNTFRVKNEDAATNLKTSF